MQPSRRKLPFFALSGVLAANMLLTSLCGPINGAVAKKKEFPSHADILKGFTKVVSTVDGKSMYNIWTRKKDNQMYAELPSSFASKKYFFALTISSGNRLAGLQAGDLYVYWRRYDKQLALMTPNVEVRSTGDKESKASVKRLFTDRMLLAVPIVTMGPSGGPVIDMDALLVGKSYLFFGRHVQNPSLRRLFSIKKAKAFPQNVELAFEVPTYGGRLQTLHYSISIIKGSAGFKPRKADERIGYFTTSYSDLGKYSDRETRVRYINRWNLAKDDSKLTLSPPKKPITFYVEHTTPIRYRRWVKKGVLYWNKAFEKVGISDAIKVEFQNPRATNESHMEKDPEDVRWNFIRWLNNNYGIAIGPSRVNPVTGEILDADIILTDGWIRHYRFQFEEMLPKVAMQGFSTETLAWLAKHPDWDPRVRMAPAGKREYVSTELRRQSLLPFGVHPASRVDPKLIGDDQFDGLVGRTSQINGLCLASEGMAFDMASMRMHLDIVNAEKEGDKKDDKKDDKKKEEKKEEKKKEKKKKEPTIDGMPESFVGPLLAHLVAHEVGHTLGLRHNFKGSSVYSLADINSEKIKGKKPLAGSVMDYNPINMNVEGGKIQGDYTMLGIGPYDFWAIEYGYTFAKDLKPILARVAEPELQYATDEDTYGPDPLARRYDFGKEPLDYAKDQLRLAKQHRAQIIEKFVKDGDSWSRARRGYELTLMLQIRAVGMMSNWVGSVFTHRDKKGDKNGRPPFEVVPAQQQRDALKFVVDNTFVDEAYGLTPQLLSRMTDDKWLDTANFFSAFEDATWPVHDRILGIQSSILTALMSPSALRRVYDNEYRVPADQDMITLPELLNTLSSVIWSELDLKPDKQYTARMPMISSLRRNLQREHLKRLIDLSFPGAGSSAAYKPISNLSLTQLRMIRSKTSTLLEVGGDKLDPYSRAHLTEIKDQVTKALDSQYIYNANDIGGGGIQFFFFGKDEQGRKNRAQNFPQPSEN